MNKFKLSLVVITTIISIGATTFYFNQDKELDPIKLMNRIGYGPTSSTLKEIKSKGYKNWINDQLENKNKYSDVRIEDRLKNLEINKKTNFELFKEYDSYLNDDQTPEYGYPDGVAYQTFKKRATYAIYSENRIREMMVWFWFNHFTVDPYGNQVSSSLLNDYENRIRNLSMGNFRDLLEMTMKHPAMLRYLNNNENKYPGTKIDKNHEKLIRDAEDGKYNHNVNVYGYNENYARELLELHTMGVNSGYTQKEIEELTKILTGLGFVDYLVANKYVPLKKLKQINTFNDFKDSVPFKFNDVFYYYFENEHDFSDKIFLGKTIKGSGEKEISDVLDLIVMNESTAKFLSTKIATYFLGEKYNTDIIKEMSMEYMKNNGNISKVLSVLLNSKEFKLSIEKQDKYKDVYSNYMSLYKVTSNGYPIDDFSMFYNKLYEMDLSPYKKQTPEGYSLIGSDYISAQIKLKTINFTNGFIFYPEGHFQKPYKYKIDYEFLKTINPSIKDKDSLFYYVNSPTWLYN